MDDGADAEGSVPDEVVVVGGEHGLLRVDAVGEQEAEALRLLRRRRGGGGGGLGGDGAQVRHLQHRLDVPRPVREVPDLLHRARGQLRRVHRVGGEGRWGVGFGGGGRREP